MPILAMSAGTVVAIRGTAFIRLPDGTLQPLNVGDKVKGGQHIVTDDASWVQISPDPDARPVVAAPPPADPVTQAITAIETDEEAPAAGLTGGAAGGLLPGLRVDRVQEGVSPLSYQYDTARGPDGAPAGSTADQRALPAGEGEPTPAPLLPPTLDLDADNSTATGTGYQTATQGNGAAVAVVDTDALITDADSTQMSGATVVLTNPQAGDKLSAGTMPAGITATVAADGNSVTLSGAASLADYQTALKAITFASTVNVPNTTPRQIEVAVTDAQGNSSNTAVSTVNVSVSPQPPALDLDANNSTASGTSYQGSATDIGGPVSVVDTDVSISDADSTQMSGATVTLTNPKSGDALAFGNLPAGITATLSPDGTKVTLTGNATLTDYQNALKAVTFEAKTPGGDTTPRQIEIVVTDPQGNNSNTAVSTINVGVVPPVLSIFSTGAVEGDNVPFVLALNKPSNEAITVKLALADGTNLPGTPQNESATVGVDTGTQLQYESAPGVWLDVPASGELTFAAGQTQINLRVSTVDDKIIEPNEFVRLNAEVVSGRTQNATAAIEAEIRNDDTAPTIQAASGTVSEDALPDGLPDAGQPAGSTVLMGKLQFADADGDSLTVTVGAPTEPVFVAGSNTPVTWTSDGKGGLVGTVGTGPSAVVAATLEVSADGSYTFTLKQPLDHPATGADQLPISFPVTVSDGVNSASSTLTVQVKDDTPVPANINSEVASLDTNVLIVLDTSSSMRSPSGIGDLNRLQAAVKAIGELLDRYDDVGNVKVRLVTFNSTANALGEAWLTVADAKALLSTVKVTGQTNYDLALDTAMQAYATNDGKLGSAQSVAYFLSDGNPTLSREFPLSGVNGQDGSLTEEFRGDGIGASEQAAWRSFLQQNHIKSYAVGIGEEVDRQFLDPVSFDGQAGASLDGVVVTDLTQLQKVLNSTATEFAEGNLGTAGTVESVMGADGFGRVEKIVVDGVSYVYDPNNTSLSITTALGGQLRVDMATGDYRYAASPNVTGRQTESFDFTLSDADGDQVTSKLLIQVDKTSAQFGTTGDDVINGTAQADALYAGSGNDTVSGGAGNDLLYGGAGNDRLSGGAGNDILLGGEGADVFAWRLGDQGTGGVGGTTAVDVIRGFDVKAPAQGGDVLDLRDLLVGENTSGGTGNLDKYLRFESSGADTVIHVSHTGDFTASGAGTETQRIVLKDVDLRDSLQLAPGAGDVEVIAKLLQQNKLIVDAS